MVACVSLKNNVYAEHAPAGAFGSFFFFGDRVFLTLAWISPPETADGCTIIGADVATADRLETT